MRYPSVYKVAGTEVKNFKELDDEKALKLVALVYNAKYGNWEDGIARSLTLQDCLALLAKRKSQCIKDSGIFNLEYEKVDLSKRKDEDLIKLYNSLEPKASVYYIDAAPDLTEMENTERIIYLTSISGIRRDVSKIDPRMFKNLFPDR